VQGNFARYGAKTPFRQHEGRERWGTNMVSDSKPKQIPRSPRNLVMTARGSGSSKGPARRKRAMVGAPQTCWFVGGLVAATTLVMDRHLARPAYPQEKGQSGELWPWRIG
jgi:hypothetical protein